MFTRWETPTRYYTAEVRTDLLGDLILERSWGGRANNRGNSSTALMRDQGQVMREMRKLAALRARHGYTVVVATPAL